MDKLRKWLMSRFVSRKIKLSKINEAYDTIQHDRAGRGSSSGSYTGGGYYNAGAAGRDDLIRIRQMIHQSV